MKNYKLKIKNDTRCHPERQRKISFLRFFGALPLRITAVMFTFHFSFFIFNCLYSATSDGTAGFQFLKIATGARAASLSEAFTGVMEGAATLQYNPAGLGALKKTEIQFSSDFLWQDVQLNSFEIVAPLGHIFSVGLGYKSLGAKDISRDNYGVELGAIDFKDTAVTFGFSAKLSEKYLIGFNFNSISREIKVPTVPYKNTAASFDTGLGFIPNPRDTYGLVVRNIGSDSAFKGSGFTGEKEKLPLEIRMGGGHRLRPFMLSWDVMQKIDEQISGAAGFEYNIMKALSVRAGISYQKYPDVSFGFGTEVSVFTLDYALTPRESLGSSHKVSLSIKW